MTNYDLDIDKLLVGDIYTSSEVLDNLILLCDEYGSRQGATPGNLPSVEFMVKKFRSYGLEVHYESFKIPGWKRGKATLKIIDPIEKEIDCISLCTNLPGEVEAKLVDLSSGSVDVYEKMKTEINGNIALVSSKRPADAKHQVHRTEKFMRSVLAGAKGWVYVNNTPGVGPVSGGVSPLIPAVCIAFEDGEYLSRLINRKGEVKVQLKTTDKYIDVNSYNVVADLPGVDKDDEYALVGAHYDGHDIAQGAGDSGSGAVVVMEMARSLSKVRDKLKRRIRFLCFGCEEIGLLGSRAYAKQHIDELGKCRLMLNLDSAGEEERNAIKLNGLPEVEPIVKKWVKEMKNDLPVSQTLSAPYSDHWPFFREGVPVSGSGADSPAQPAGPSYAHTRWDTVEKANLNYLRQAASNYARFMYRVANADTWPVEHRSKEKIEEYVKTQGWYESVALTDKVRDHVKGWKQISPVTRAWLETPDYW